MSKSIPISPRTTDWLQHVTLVMLRLALLLLTIVTLPAVSEQAAPSRPVSAQGALEVFVRDGCPHCAEAKIFLSKLSSERPQLRIIYRSIDNDPNARDELIQHSKDACIWPPGVPAFVFDGRIIVGFDDAEHSGPALLALINQTATCIGSA